VPAFRLIALIAVFSARLLASLVACFAFLVPTSASATLMDMGRFTRDTDQGIDWLDLTETNGLSVNDALATFPGWELANGSQVCAFVQDAVPSGLHSTFYRCGGSSPAQFSGGRPPWNMIGLWGKTIQEGITPNSPYWGSDATGSAGIFSDSPDFGKADIWTLASNSGSYRSVSRSFDTATNGIGVFLVRPIPEPSTALLVAWSLAGLGVARKKIRASRVGEH
jgi:hypothetical protein